MVSEETPASTRKHLSQARWAPWQGTGLAELNTDVPLAQTRGSVLRLEELLTQARESFLRPEMPLQNTTQGVSCTQRSPSLGNGHWS